MLRYLAKQDVVFAAAAARERSLAVQMADRIVQVLRVYHADSPLLKEMEEAANTAKQDLEGREAVSRSR
jgi:precorrin-2 methylase